MHAKLVIHSKLRAWLEQQIAARAMSRRAAATGGYDASLTVGIAV